MRKHIAYLLCILLSASGQKVWAADEVNFTASAPKQVVEGQPFQVTYTINHRAGSMQAPEFVDFDFLAGPYTSTSSSTSITNGKVMSSVQQQYTYTLMPRKQGTFSIGPASIKVGSREYNSNGLKITVLPPDQATQSGTQNSGNHSSVRQAQTTDNGNADIFVRTIVSKTTLHEQEVLSLSYKLYVIGVDIRGFTEKTSLPECTGFLKQDLEQKDIQFELEHYNGRNYQVATIYRTLLYPQHSGDIRIDPASFEAIILIPNTRRRSFFDDVYIQATRMLTAPAQTIHVQALPSGKPKGYCGGVGRFTMNASVSATDIQTNDAITVRVNIKGTGNMKLLKTPAIDWPEGFEAYDPKVTNNYQTTASGMSGTKTIEYLAIARNSGDYTIPSIQFAYFDTESGQYRTLSSDEYTIHVSKGASDTQQSTESTTYVPANREDIKELGNDIRYIFTGVMPSRRNSPNLTLNLLTLLLYLVPTIIAIVLFILFRHRIRENADLVRVRYRQANRVAQKRLKAAKTQLDNGHSEAFYAEIERAAFSYLSDRLSIPTADLSKDNIADILRRKSVPEPLIQEVLQLLSTTEFARYAPASDDDRQDMYKQTANLINKLESQKL